MPPAPIGAPGATAGPGASSADGIAAERERWREVDRIFASVLGLPEDERRRLLDRECAGDEELRREVESQLAHDRDDSFLEDGAFVEAGRVAAEHAGSSLVGQSVGRFAVEALLGAGGMGEVYRARDPRLGRSVALKVIPTHLSDDPERRRRFRQEALAASALNHPNIVTVHEILELEDRDVLVTELVDGTSLRDRLRGGVLPIADALDIALQVARGLAAAHAVGVVHRDVKPENVMVRRDGLVKLLDFGIAKSLTEPAGAPAGDGESETQPGRILGTGSYMSPEQGRGLPVDARTDVWSLGVILYEMLTAEAPFRGKTPSDTLAAILIQDPEPPSRRREGLPPELDHVLARALAKEASRRHASAEEMAEDLERLRTTTADAKASARPSWLSPDSPRSARMRLPVALRAAAATVLGVLLVGWLAGRDAGGAELDSLAVMPLVDDTGDPQSAWVADGITESLIQSLGQSDGLRVISRASVFRYKGTSTPPRAIGRDLGVRGVLSGHLERRGDRISLEVELIDARDESHLWGDRYEIRGDELGSLHHRVAADVLRQLRGPSGADETRERAAARRTVDPEAHRLYLQGIYFWKRAAPEDYHRSVELFRHAVEVAPGYALAWGGLARYYSFGAATGLLDPSQAWPLAEEACESALALEPQVPEIASVMASIALFARRDWVAGEQQLRRAAEMNAETLNVVSFYLNLLGHFDESLAYRRRYLEVDPLSVRANRSFGHALYLARRHEEAAAQLRRTLELDRADVLSWELLGDALLELGRGEEAVAAWRQGMLVDGKLELALLLERSHTASGVGAAIGAVARERVAALLARRHSGAYVPAYLIARQHLRAGDRDAALEWTLRALEERNRFPLDLRVDPVFDELRDEPRFREALERVALPPLAG